MEETTCRKLVYMSITVTCVLLIISHISQAEEMASYPSDDSKVELSLYYESLCPFCANFIVNQLVKVFQTDLISIVKLRLILWGNTHLATNNTWICQHGADECRLDIVEACAVNVWPQVEIHYKLIYCIERLHLMNRYNEWQSCFGATNLNPTPIKTCYTSGLGFQLENKYAAETARLNPPHRFVPWVLVNNVPLQEDYQNFIAYICRAYKGSNVPQSCKSLPVEINSSKIAASGYQVCMARWKK